MAYAVKVFVESGLIEYLMSCSLEERATISSFAHGGVPPEVIATYAKGGVSYNSIMKRFPEESVIAIEKAISRHIEEGQEDGNDIRILIDPKEPIESHPFQLTIDSSSSSEIDEMSKEGQRVMDEINDTIAAAGGEVLSAAERMMLLEEPKPKVYKTKTSGDGGNSSSGISTAGAVGIGIGVVAVAAAAYWGYNCFIADGCDDDITLLD